MRKNRKIYRKCLVCGRRLCITLRPNGEYSNGNYFGILRVEVEGTGEHVKVGKSEFFNSDIVDWTGEYKEVEYWECNECFNEKT